MSWTTALNDLKVTLSDAATDKLRWGKSVLDQPNGTRTKFKTFEFRRVTNFTTSAAPEGVYVNDTLAAVAADFPEYGQFQLAVAPAEGARIEATYYVKFFTDIELIVFLAGASKWLGVGEDYTLVAPGLQPSAIKYASADAYQKLALRFAEHLSETFRFQDSQDPKRGSIVDQYRQFASDYRKEATTLRDQFYTRQGQSLQPLFSSISGSVSDPMPKR